MLETMKWLIELPERVGAAGKRSNDSAHPVDFVFNTSECLFSSRLNAVYLHCEFFLRSWSWHYTLVRKFSVSNGLFSIKEYLRIEMVDSY
jgi:hypothetical protein